METAAGLNSLKKHVFYELLHIGGRVFVLVRNSEHVVLGNRGFTPDERENGIVLVFNTGMNFQWDDYGITATLVFGSSPQKCFIPVDDITAVYSSELNTQFIVLPMSGKIQDFQAESTVRAEGTSVSAGNVIKVDFTKRQKKDNPAEGKDGDG
jgi:hypothetical protein